MFCQRDISIVPRQKLSQDGNISDRVLEMVWTGRRLQDGPVPTSLPWAEVPELLRGWKSAVTHHPCWCYPEKCEQQVCGCGREQLPTVTIPPVLEETLHGLPGWMAVAVESGIR